jgi:hypothetical protein
MLIQYTNNDNDNDSIIDWLAKLFSLLEIKYYYCVITY